MQARCSHAGDVANEAILEQVLEAASRVADRVLREQSRCVGPESIEQRFPACSPASCSERSGCNGRMPEGPVGDPAVSCRASRL